MDNGDKRGGTLITHRGAVRIPKAELMTIEPPASMYRWRPVAHGVLVNTLIEILSGRGLAVWKEDYAVQNDENTLFGVLDLAWGDTGEFYAALGLRTSNNKSFAIQIAIGARVVVCDNLLERRQTATAWEVLNSFTTAMKQLPPSVQFASTGKLGKFFDLGHSHNRDQEVVETI